YDGPEKSRREVAILKAARFYGEGMIGRISEETTIHSVNGRAVDRERVEVLPGPCQIGVTFSEDYAFGDREISEHPLAVTFEAEAGKEYLVRGSGNKKIWE